MPRCPSTGGVTAKYGPRTYRPTPTSPLFHYGEDTVGSGNYAPVSGTIVYAGYYGSYGNIIGVRENSNIVWWMAHNASLNGRKPGQSVREGEYLAPLGATGNVTGPHVHTERRVGGGNTPGSGSTSNPRAYYGTTTGSGSTTPPTEIPNKPKELENDMAILIRHADTPKGRRFVVFDTNLYEVLDDFLQTNANKAATQNRAELWRVVAPPSELFNESALTAMMRTFEGLKDKAALANWRVTVARGGKDVTALQELADAKTQATNAAADAKTAAANAKTAADAAKTAAAEAKRAADKPVSGGTGGSASTGLSEADKKFILDNLNKIPANTLATFGLKRV